MDVELAIGEGEGEVDGAEHGDPPQELVRLGADEGPLIGLEMAVVATEHEHRLSREVGRTRRGLAGGRRR
jgi:hypothetical protein